LQRTTPPTADFQSGGDTAANGIMGEDVVTLASRGTWIYVPDTAVNTYKTTAGWSVYASRIKGVSERPQAISDDDDITGITDMNGSYLLTDDIEVPSGWTPIGTDGTPFTGIFDGGGHTITVSAPPDSAALDDPGIGLFGSTDGAEIRNVTVNVTYSIIPSRSGDQNIGGVVGSAEDTTFENIAVTGTLSISDSGTSGSFAAGGLAGQLSGTSKISSCYSTADIIVTSGHDYTRAGGLAGDCTGTTQIEKSFATGNITASTSKNYVWAGGLGGIVSENTSIENCYATGNVEGTAALYAYVGGLVGEFDGTLCNTKCTKSYASGNVTATISTGGISAAGGIAGKINSGAELSFCAAISGSVTSSGSTVQNVGAVIGQNNGTANNNIANADMIVTPSPGNGNMGTSTDYDDFANSPTYTALVWDFTNVWKMDLDSGRPKLRP
jgi:hypothetical protein